MGILGNMREDGRMSADSKNALRANTVKYVFLPEGILTNAHTVIQEGTEKSAPRYRPC